MPNEYGDVTVDDLNQIAEQVSDSLRSLVEDRNEAYRLLMNRTIIPAKVVKIGTADDVSKRGAGVIQVAKIASGGGSDTNVWARPYGLQRGRFDVPKVDSWVYLVRPYMRDDTYEYFGEFWFDPITPFPTSLQDADTLDNGFVTATPQYRYGGKRMKEAIANPETEKIFESTEDFIFGYDKTAKKIDLSVDENFEVVIRAGNGGKIRLVAADPATEVEGATTSIDIEFDTGNNGTFTVKSGTATVEKMVLGETLKAKLDSFFDIFINHNHNALGASPPLNATDAATLKSELGDILSEKNKNN